MEGFLVIIKFMKKTKTKWIIKISGEVKFLVKLGDRVVAGQVIAKVKPKIVESFNFSNFFGKMNQENLEKLNEKFKNTWVNSGELVCLTGGVFPKKICFPMSGNFVEIDEFGFLKIETKEDGKKEILASVNSLVSKIEIDKLTLEFKAIEFKGQGLVAGKSWGETEFTIVNDAKDLNSKLKNKIIFTNNLTNGFLLKSEVVGVVGVITNSELKGEEITTEIPILKVDDLVWEKLIKYQGDHKKMLLNSRLDRLLLVIE